MSDVVAAASPLSSAPSAQGLYDPRHEHDACGVGFVAHVKGKKSHSMIEQGLKILDNLSHRGATGYDPLLGDGAGILIQLPDAHLRRVCGKQGMTLPAFGQYGVGMYSCHANPHHARHVSRKSNAPSMLKARFCWVGAMSLPITTDFHRPRSRSSR